MILSAIVLFAAFVVARFLFLRGGLTVSSANVGASVVVASFVVGSLARPFGFPGSDATAMSPVASTDGTSLPAPQSFPSPADMAAACKADAPIANRTVGYFDSLATGSSPAALPMNGMPIARDQAYVATGWAADVDGKEPAVGACLVVDGKIVRTARSIYGSIRPDVAKSFGASNLTPVGFVLTIPRGSLPDGNHTIAVAALSHDGTYARTHNAWQVIVH